MSYEEKINHLHRTVVNMGNSAASSVVSFIDSAYVAKQADKEIAELKESGARAIRHCKVMARKVMARKVDELTAHCERLKESLKEIDIAAYACEGGCGVSSIAERAVEKPPSQSLAKKQTHDWVYLNLMGE